MLGFIKRSRMITAWMLIAAFLLGTVSVSYAGSEGRKNTALALTGAAVYPLLKGNTGGTVVFGAGSLYAWKKYRDKRDEERERAYRSDERYRVYYPDVPRRRAERRHR